MNISKLSFPQRSLLFAKLSSIAYNDNIKEVKKQVKTLGFTTVEFYNREGAQAYRFMNKDDIVIACRGTQPTEFNDISSHCTDISNACRCLRDSTIVSGASRIKSTFGAVPSQTLA